jgi:hypothetical protein
MSRVRRLGTAVALGVLLTASPAFADNNPIGDSEGAEPGRGLGLAATLLLFVVLPLAAAILIGAIAYLPGALTSHRYRPAKGWSASPVWFAGPPEPAAAVQSAQTGDVVRGGASGSW